MLWRKPQRRELALDSAGQLGERLGAERHSGPEDPGARRRGKGAEAPQGKIEWREPDDGAPQRRVDQLEPGHFDAAEELERDVEILGGDPGRPADERTQPLDPSGQGRADGGVELDRDERADGLYRAVSTARSKRSRLPRRAGSVSIASAALRSEIAPA
jgi:hypothetical protein